MMNYYDSNNRSLYIYICIYRERETLNFFETIKRVPFLGNKLKFLNLWVWSNPQKKIFVGLSKPTKKNICGFDQTHEKKIEENLKPKICEIHAQFFVWVWCNEE